MNAIQFIPVGIFVATVAALVYLSYRRRASLTREEKLEELVEQHAAAATAAAEIASWPERIEQLMPAFITVVVLLASIYIILSPGFGSDKNKWAYGSIGMILGYWLRSTVRPSRGRRRSR